MCSWIFNQMHFMLIKKILLLFLLFPVIGFSQEMTTTDITATKNFDARKISILGLSLGMSRADVIKIIQINPDLSYREEKMDTIAGSSRIYVFHSHLTKEISEFNDSSILCLTWWNNQKESL